ncbi:SapC family protein [Colwellia ponticola]|uniref:SapC family protein n=1 Tax=Colwellia ponticola TaxID=2304625 RepID=A0A8H2JQ10_9GAMM|nr:SapC family protein [Colwellia ponticola]TMM45716.1 SapC family protein [Colwellia ponticola]
MANFVAIKADKHHNLKLASKRDLAHVAEQHIVPVTAAEYAQASASFPVVLVKNPESPRYRSVVMLGLEAGENLFYNDSKWTGLSLPQSVGMAPFALGLDPDKENTLTACVDVESNLVGEDKELALFEAEGKESELLINVQNSLGRLYENEKMTESFIKELEENDLLQELELNVNLTSGEKKKLTGVFTINEDKVKALAEDKVIDFHKRGLFVPIYAMLGSLGQVNRLVQLRNLTGKNDIAGIQIAPLVKADAETATAES